jgi:hypothetical protein
MVEEEPSETSLLTLREQGEMLVRHAESIPLASVIKAAMKRRLSET